MTRIPLADTVAVQRAEAARELRRAFIDAGIIRPGAHGSTRPVELGPVLCLDDAGHAAAARAIARGREHVARVAPSNGEIVALIEVAEQRRRRRAA